jgi:16S rRNA processing protein RimM
VAQVVAPHGIRGELKCRVITDFPKQRFKRGNVVLIDGQERVIQSARVQDGTVLLKLEGVTDRDMAESLRNAQLMIKAADAVQLPKGEFYWHQVIGLTVQDVTSNALLGTVADILETGANDVYVVKTPDGKELLVPAIKDVVKDINPTEGKLLIAPLPGMIPR